MTKLEQARKILSNCKTPEDVYTKKDALKNINVGIFCDIPHMCRYTLVRIYSLRLGKFHRFLGRKTLL
jgi:hypothetical protein